MPKKRVAGIRWQPIGASRRDRVQWHTSTRAIVMGKAARLAASGGRTRRGGSGVPFTPSVTGFCPRCRKERRKAGGKGAAKLSRERRWEARMSTMPARSGAERKRQAKALARVQKAKPHRKTPPPMTAEEQREADRIRSERERAAAREREHARLAALVIPDPPPAPTPPLPPVPPPPMTSPFLPPPTRRTL